MLKFSDARNFGRTFTGLALIAGPLVFLIAQIVSPDVDNDNKLTELNDIAAHKGTYLFGGILFLLGGAILLGASIGLIHLFRDRRVTLGQVAAVLLALGSAATFAFYTFVVVEYEMVNQPGLDRAQMAKFLHESNEAASGLPIFILFIVGIVIGLILLAIAAWRRRVVPPRAALVILVGGVIAFFSQSKALGIVDFVILLVGLGWLGTAVLSTSDDQWDGPRGAEAPPGAAAVEPGPAS